MALNAYLKLKGQKQGDIHGSVTVKGHENQIEINAVDHQVNVPFEPASGQASGKRQHQPIVLTKDVDKSSPLLYNALVQSENLTSFQLTFSQAAARGGQEQQYYIIKLTNARIVGIKMEMLNNNTPDLVRYNEREKVAFTYQKIEWTYVTGGITADDDWEAVV